MINQLTDAELREKIKQYAFYHQFRLTETITTPCQPIVQPSLQSTLRALEGFDFHDKRVLDVGCRDGLFSFEAERRGAREVVGIDNDLSPAAVEFLAPFFRSQVRFSEMNLFDLAPATFGKFDVILFPGVLYHLRYPVWGLKRLQEVMNPRGTLLIETALIVDENEHALLYCPIGEESPYEPSSCTFFNVKGLSDTLLSLGFEVQSIHNQDEEVWRMYGQRSPPLESPQPGLRQRIRAVFFPPKPTAAPPKPSGMVIARSCFLCEFRPELINPHLTMYWDGTHQFHRTSPNVPGSEAA